MKVKKIAEFNPAPASPIAGRSEIDYIDTAAVVEGRLGDVQRLSKMFPSRAQREIHTNDILISSVRPNLKHNFFVDDSADGMIASSGFIHVRVKNSSDVSPRFLYYYLTSPAQVQRYVKIADSSQSAYPSFNKDVVENIELPEIDLPTQLRIAGILGRLDEKIELNRKKIAELEALAKTIYDYWFVQFDFPDKNGKPYKSSGGKMVWNEQLKREVPEGWEVVPLESLLARLPITKRLPTDEYGIDGEFPIIDQSEAFIAGYSSNQSAVLSLPKCVVFGDHSCTVKMVNFPFCRGADGTQILVSNDESVISTYQLYLYIEHLKFDGQYKRHFSFLKQFLIPLKRTLYLGQAFSKLGS